MAGEWVRKRDSQTWHWLGWNDKRGVHTMCGRAFPAHDVATAPSLPTGTEFKYCTRCYSKFARHEDQPLLSGIGFWGWVVILFLLGLLWSGVSAVCGLIGGIGR